MTRATVTTSPVTSPGTIAPAQLAELRRMLEQQQRFRVEQLVALGTPGATGPFASANDEITGSLATGARAALHDVRDALRRLDEGRYGRCTACSSALAVERLEILPQVALCMPCQRAAEQSAQAQAGVRSE